MRRNNEYRLPQEWQDNISFKPVVFDLLEDVLLFCMFLPAMQLIFYAFERGPTAYFRPLLELAVFFAFTLFRRYLKIIALYVLALIGVVFAVFAFPAPLGSRIIATCIAAIAAGVSGNLLHKELLRKEIDYSRPQSNLSGRFLGPQINWVGLILIYLSYMISLALHLTPVIAVCFVSFTVFLAVYQIYVHMSGICALKDWEQTEQGNSSKKFTVFFTALIAVGIGLLSFILYKIVYSTGLNRVDNSFLYFLTKKREYAAASLPSVSQATASSPQMDLSKLTAGATKPNLFLKIMSVVLKTVCWILAAAGILFVLAAILRWALNMVKLLRRNINEETQSVFSLEETKKNIKTRLQHIPLISNLIQGNSNRIKIRRLYFRAVSRSDPGKAKIQNSDTPAEISGKLSGKSRADIFALTELYEKARYSNMECTAEDVKTAKTYSEGKPERPAQK